MKLDVPLGGTPLGDVTVDGMSLDDVLVESMPPGGGSLERTSPEGMSLSGGSLGDGACGAVGDAAPVEVRYHDGESDDSR